MNHAKSLLWNTLLILVIPSFAGCSMTTTQSHSPEIDPIIVDLPVRGLWITPNSPGTRVPSHGTTLFGETYAIDFVMIENQTTKKPYRSSFLTYVLKGVPLADFYGWGEPIYSPVNGQVIDVENNVGEREIVNPFSDLNYARKATREAINGNLDPARIAGNYVLIKISDRQYALLAHLVRGSVSVQPGQSVRAGQMMGKLGHSGNSTMPHLHMQFMNSPDFSQAEGIPFVFREYKKKVNGAWQTERLSLPTTKDIIRE